jgi:hypothetical protein
MFCNTVGHNLQNKFAGTSCNRVGEPVGQHRLWHCVLCVILAFSLNAKTCFLTVFEEKGGWCARERHK